MFVFVHLTACHLLQGWEGGIPCFWTMSFCQQKVIQLGSCSAYFWMGSCKPPALSLSFPQACLPSPPSHLLDSAAFSVSGELGKDSRLKTFPISFWLQFDICFVSWLGLYPVQALCSKIWWTYLNTLSPLLLLGWIFPLSSKWFLKIVYALRHQTGVGKERVVIPTYCSTMGLST